MSSADSASQKMIVLKSSDGETFEVEAAVAFQSQTIQNMIVDNCAPLPVDVASKILVKVIEYCKRYVDAAVKATGDGSLAVDEDLKAFDAEFVKVDNDTLLDLISAAHYLKIKSLLDLTSQTVADVMKGMTPEEMRKNFSRLCDPNVWILPDE